MKLNAPRIDYAPPRVAVFAKAPVPGAVKTRLIPVLGAEGAAELHEAMVRYALTVATHAMLGPVELWCMPDTSHPFLGKCARDFRVSLHRQEGPDLGARMALAFARAQADGDRMVLIGSDCPALKSADLEDAARALLTHDAVLTPAEDGGYVMVALAGAAPIFHDMVWGGADVMEQTRARLESADLRWVEMETLWDVDRPEDYQRLQAMRLRESSPA